MDICPCGSNLTYSECCEPLIRGERPAQTAEELLRSRYTAYTKAEIEYVLATTHPDHRHQYDENSTREWAENSEWHQLEILSTTAGGVEDDNGEVEFIALYTQDGIKNKHHERAEFRKKDGVWYFWDGEGVVPKPFVRQAPKVSRNDPCPCGSGKKFKKCCGK